MYCSNGAAAFDRLKVERNILPKLVAVLVSWLRQRVAHVIVGGTKSLEMALRDVSFQNTVLGPTLWSIFVENGRLAINEWLFTEVAFGDDL